ncbi:hypothetical protein L1887_16867 [Cichorium endivia]|nr:hypothetical protein L1887_16867 [Cichorium endivia]
MNINDIEYFSQLLELHSAYRVSDFNCKQTKTWQRTLPNPTSIRFGNFTKFEKVSPDDFPNHHFNFISYNQLSTRLPKNSILTGELKQSGNPNSNQIVRRVLDIENLKQRYEDKEKEKTRNRIPLAVLLTQNPDTYKYVRFTCEGTVVEISNVREWFHYTCVICNKKLTVDGSMFECQDHGQQPEPNNSPLYKKGKIEFILDDIFDDVLPLTKSFEIPTSQLEIPEKKETQPQLEAQEQQQPNYTISTPPDSDTKKPLQTPGLINKSTKRALIRTLDETAPDEMKKMQKQRKGGISGPSTRDNNGQRVTVI